MAGNERDREVAENSKSCFIFKFISSYKILKCRGRKFNGALDGFRCHPSPARKYVAGTFDELYREAFDVPLNDLIRTLNSVPPRGRFFGVFLTYTERGVSEDSLDLCFIVCVY